MLIGYLVKQVQAEFKVKMDGVLSRYDLTASSYAALFHLEAGERDEMSNADLAREAWVTPQTMHRISTRLAEDGFIEEASREGRAVKYRITEEGLEKFQAADDEVKRLEAAMLAGLDEGDVEKLREGLRVCMVNLEGFDA